MIRPTPAAILLSLTITAAARSAAAQGAPSVGGRSEIFAGGELENYLRYLQTLGEVAPYPWGVRAFSPAELDRLMPRDTMHPWAARYDLTPRAAKGISVDWVAPTASVRYNSTFPYGYNDGPIWAGRGFTVAVQAGVAVRWGPFSLTAAPLVFDAQNAAFPLQPNGETGRLAYANAHLSPPIDLPQRFGANGYGRVDAGQTTARLDLGPIAAGVTTANQYWGPATEFPFVLGNNAAGFPQVFAGTSHPLDLWLLRLHVRMLWGRLGQSAFSPETASAGVRYATGINLNLSSRRLPGLELGFTRFSHQPWPAGGLLHADLLKVLRYQEASNISRKLSDYQLASAYFRWLLPRSGFEVYGEYGREDYNMNLRDIIEEPDHDAGYTIGFRKAIRRAGNHLLAVRAELQNTQASVLAQGRDTPPTFYSHVHVPEQGHTQLGQLLGSPAGQGGAGSVVAVESYSASGRWTFSWTRIVQAQRSVFTSADLVEPATQADPKGLDVQHELAVERLAFLGRYDVLAHVGGVYEFNRYFQHDAFNLNVILSVRYALR